MLDTIVTLIMVGPILGLFSTWLFLRYRQPPKPKHLDRDFEPADFLSQEQQARLGELWEYEQQCWREKAQIYLRGDRLGLHRRASDARFYRRGDGIKLDDALAQLDRRFHAAEEEVRELMGEAFHAGHTHAQNEANWDWHRRYLRKIEIEFVAYICGIIGIALFLPSWARFVSGFAETHLLLPLPLPAILHGAIFLASLGAAIPLVWVTSNGVWESLPGRGSADDDSKERIAQFEAAPEVTDFDTEDDPDECESSEDQNEIASHSPYEMLGVEATASRDDIMAAYRKLVRQYHPDYLQDRGEELKQLADRKMKEINWAKEKALRNL